MDADRFDTLTRSLHDMRSRRGVLRLLAASAIGLLGWQRDDGASAHDALKKCKKLKGERKKRCVKKARKHDATHISCTPSCAGKTCGPDGCGGTCGNCNGACPNGACICPSGSRLCGDTCQQCCVDLHCEGGRTCQNGTCACPLAKPTFCPVPNICAQCCDNTPCCGKAVCDPGEQVCLGNRTCGCIDGRPPCNGRCCDQFSDCSGGSCAAISDRNMKANVASVDPADMLGRVRALPISTWNYTSDDPAIRHIGPMAQDFAALFGVGSDDRHIHPIDGQGVALAAIQGLLTEMEQMRKVNAQLAARISALEGEK